MIGDKLSWGDLRLLFPDYERSLSPLLELSQEKYQIQRDSHLVQSYFHLPLEPLSTW